MAKKASDNNFRDIATSAAFIEWQQRVVQPFLEERSDENLYSSLLRLKKFLDVFGDEHLSNMRFSEPIPTSEIKACEEALGIKLPQSYVELVTQHGIFKFDLVGNGLKVPTTYASPDIIDLPFQVGLYSPKQIRQRTQSSRQYDIDYPNAKILPQGGITAVEFLYMGSTYCFWWKQGSAISDEPQINKSLATHEENFHVDFDSFIRKLIKNVIKRNLVEK